MAKKIKKIGKEFIILKLEDIHPYENNPRLNEDAVPYVAESIKQCTDLDPIEIDENNVILSGHTRLLAMQQLGYKETDCIRYTGLTETQKKKYRLLANKVAEKSAWDFDKLPEELEVLDFDDFDFGFDSQVEIQINEGKTRKSINFNETISVCIDCENEEQAEIIFEKLQSEGYECRISTL